MKEINATLTKKTDNPLNVRRGSREEIRPLQGFFTVSLLLADFHLLINLFIRFQECQMCIQIREIKVVEINAPLN